jgi:pilus assembly protein CpaC
MMIAGLLQEKTRQSIDSLPGLMNLPVLGSLFRSRDYVSGETELVIIVEPYLVSATSPGRMQTPVDGMRIASDPEAVLLGKLTKRSAAPTGAPPPGPYQGPVGYVIE